MDVRWTAVAVAVVVMAPAASAALFDQVDNGEFEDWEDGEPVEWRLAAGQVTATSGPEGQAAQLTAPGGPKATLAQTITPETGEVPIVEGATYELSFAADLRAPSGETAEATLVWLDAEGQQVGTHDVAIPEGSGFASHAFHAQAPEGAVGVDVAFTLHADGDSEATLAVDGVVCGPADAEEQQPPSLPQPPNPPDTPDPCQCIGYICVC